MRAIRAIALNTFREAVRNKVLYSLVFFSFALMLLSLVLDDATVGQRHRIVKDLGLGALNIVGVMIAIVVGINLVYKEIEKRTIFPLLAKPVRRSQFLIGKYFGVLLTLFVETALMSLFFFLLVLAYGSGLDGRLVLAVFMIFIELSVVASVAIFFSSFSTPFLSGMFTFSVYVMGHLTEDLKAAGAKSGSVVTEYITSFFYTILPNLEHFNLKPFVVSTLPIDSRQVMLSLFYALIYVTAILYLSVLCFQRRDFK